MPELIPLIPDPDLGLAYELFESLHSLSFDGVGITRDSYGSGEQRAHDLLQDAASRAGLEIHRDAALNLYMTLPGQSRQAPVVMTGSHLDSVPRGGNFDGAAGVVAGLAILVGWAKAGHRPLRDVTVMAIRAEESAWFPVSYIGSKAAFGKLPAQALQALRADNGLSLAEHLDHLGGDSAAISNGDAWLTSERIDSFFELHIEQGPVLIEAGFGLGVVSGICGSLRYRKAQALGNYAHSGATPRSHRRDAVVAVSALVMAMQAAWQDLEEQGHHLTVTVGQFSTDPLQADFSTVAGQVDFCIDVRSESVQTLELMDQRLQTAVAEIARKYCVEIHLGEQTRTLPGYISTALAASLHNASRFLGYEVFSLPSGAGHDAASFAGMGVKTAMLFVRNANGSHNPSEAMDHEDFAAATRVLGLALAERADASTPV